MSHIRRTVVLVAIAAVIVQYTSAQELVRMGDESQSLARIFEMASPVEGQGSEAWIGYSIPTAIIGHDRSVFNISSGARGELSFVGSVHGGSTDAKSIAELLSPQASRTLSRADTELAILMKFGRSGHTPTHFVVVSLSSRVLMNGARIDWLGNHNQEESYSLLQALYRNTSNVDARRGLISFVGRHDLIADSVPWLKKLVNGDEVSTKNGVTKENVGIRKSAIFALGYHPDKSIGPFLQEIIRSSTRSENLRKAAVYSVANRNTDEAFSLLGGTIRTKELPVSIRKAAVYAVGGVEHTGVLRLLEDLIAETSETELAKAAVYSMADVGARSIAPLVRAFQSTKSTSVQKAAIYAIAGAESNDAVSALRDIINGTHTSQIRKAAVYALGNIGTDEARDVLISLVGTI